jgi:predicted RecA/RadA family phage recombinase
MALSADRTLVVESTHHITNHTVASAVTIYKGALCVTNATAGTLKPAVDEATSYFAGIALNGAAAGETVDVVDAGFYWIPAESNVDENSIGKALYANDDETVTETGTLGPVVGRCMAVVGSDALVWLNMPAATAAA